MPCERQCLRHRRVGGDGRSQSSFGRRSGRTRFGRTRGAGARMCRLRSPERTAGSSPLGSSGASWHRCRQRPPLLIPWGLVKSPPASSDRNRGRCDRWRSTVARRKQPESRHHGSVFSRLQRGCVAALSKSQRCSLRRVVAWRSAENEAPNHRVRIAANDDFPRTPLDRRFTGGSASPEVESVIAAGMQYLGRPYRIGTEGRGCSIARGWCRHSPCSTPCRFHAGSQWAFDGMSVSSSVPPYCF